MIARRRPCLATRALASVLVAAAASTPVVAQAEGDPACPEARLLPQLTIDRIQDPAVPVIDTWQVLWGAVPLSDYQIAMLSGDDLLIDRTRGEVANRGQWVYVGTLMAAAGTAISSLGWVLYGRGQVSQGVTLPLAIGGILLGAAGLLTITDSIQRPLEPLLAPTPEHRMTRDEIRAVVARINQKLYADVCKAATARPKVAEDAAH